jgi:hypothetical protein
MAVKGAEARALLRALLEAVSHLVPGDVNIEVTGQGRRCHLRASRFAEREKIPAENPFGGAMSGMSAPWGWGRGCRSCHAGLPPSSLSRTPWRPFRTPSRASRGARGPGPDYKVAVADEPLGVRAWFDNGEQQIEVGTISYELASK